MKEHPKWLHRGEVSKIVLDADAESVALSEGWTVTKGAVPSLPSDPLPVDESSPDAEPVALRKKPGRPPKAKE